MPADPDDETVARRPPDAAASAAAFFDLDRTLMQGSSAFQFARAARAHRLISRRRLAADGWANLRFRLRGSTDADSVELRTRVAEGLRGRRVIEMERLGADVLARVLPRIYPGILQIAHEHQDAGRPVWIVTAAAREFAEVLARVLAFDGAVGSQMSGIADGVYTGAPSGPFLYREGKATAIAALAVREGYDLGACFAYSDSESDLPMLSAVGHPVVVNPDAALRAIASERGWETVRPDRLGPRLRIAGTVGGVAAAGGVGAIALRRYAPAIPR